MIEPQTLTDADDTALLAVRRPTGGRLVIGGPIRSTSTASATARRCGAPTARRRTTRSTPQLGNVREVETAGRGSWTSPGSGTVLAARRRRRARSPSRPRRPRRRSSSSPIASPLENAYLARADNAAFALGLAGDAPRPVEFAEGVHGYGESRGLGAIPTPWKIALLVLAAAAVALAWSRSRRFGPPDRPARELPPAARRVRARARGVARTHPRSRRTRSRRCNSGPDRTSRGARTSRPDASLEEIDRAAIALGYSEAERAAIWHPPTDDDTALALGRLVSQLVATRWENDVNELRDRVVREVRKVVVGQDGVVEVLLASVTVGGHLLLEGVPGVAKTLVANAFARAIGVEFRRVQFTPDMLPSDLTGTMTLRAGELAFRPGPVFTNLLLADEINRTPPKTQAALLEAMQERQVSVDGIARPLPDPFIVVATQNPIEYEGTYPLPEAQLDRFLAKIDVGYPSADDEAAVLRLAHHGVAPATLDDVQAVTSPAELIEARTVVDATTVSDAIVALRRRARAPRRASCRASRSARARAAPCTCSPRPRPRRGSPAATS